MLNVILLNFVTLSVIMLSVLFFIVILSVIMLSVSMLSVIIYRMSRRHYGQSWDKKNVDSIVVVQPKSQFILNNVFIKWCRQKHSLRRHFFKR